MKSDTPEAPDPAKSAADQATANKEAAIAQANINMVDQVTPYGSLTYSQTGQASDGTPRYTATQTLSPSQQTLFDLTSQAGQKYGETANAQLDNVRGALSQGIDFSGIGAAPVANEQTRQNVAQSLYDRLNPQFDRDQAALETQLANQGIAVGSDAYGNAFDIFNRGKNDARLAAQAQAGSEMAGLYGLESAARNQAIDEIIKQRSIPLNELAAMLSGSQVQNPTYVNTPQQQIAAPDVLGATFQGYQTASDAATKQNQGLYSLLGAGAKGFSYMNPFGWGR